MAQAAKNGTPLLPWTLTPQAVIVLSCVLPSAVENHRKWPERFFSSIILIPHNNKYRWVIPNLRVIYLANFIKNC